MEVIDGKGKQKWYEINDSVLIWENTGQNKTVFWQILRRVQRNCYTMILNELQLKLCKLVIITTDLTVTTLTLVPNLDKFAKTNFIVNPCKQLII